ncbi:MAG: tRNA pseudouridine(55) synthase TruB [Deltaproteobacteria bacterium]|jgi:tRNA pseudouridine55 synthase|nr:tRNA pseudouridine(55) synthase TruB [Deltaproteobacteria bacterium]
MSVDGVLVLNKPAGISSAACVGRIRRRFGQKKTGHAGTLDPLATGVLLILLGQATKIAGLLMEGGEKIYSGVIRFGLSTDTWDAEGKIISESALTKALTQEALSGALADLLGESLQEVPSYSAAKYQGRPLYALARQGVFAPVKTKTVKISRAELEWFRPPLARFRVACGSGTYIRSLAHSLGKRFECGATLMELTREYSHPFGLEEAVALEELDSWTSIPAERVFGLQKALPHIPPLTLNADLCRRARNGRPLPAETLPRLDTERAFFLDESGRVLALAQKHREQGRETWIIGRGLWND